MQVETQVLHIVAQVLLQAAASRASAAGQMGQDHNLLGMLPDHVLEICSKHYFETSFEKTSRSIQCVARDQGAREGIGLEGATC